MELSLCLAGLGPGFKKPIKPSNATGRSFRVESALPSPPWITYPFASKKGPEMFPSDPLKNVGYRIIYTSVVIHGVGLAGMIGGSPVRHVAGIVAALIWSLWMIYGSSKFPWIMNIMGTAVGAIAFAVSGIGVISKSLVGGLSMILIGIVFADLCRRLCSREVSANFE